MHIAQIATLSSPVREDSGGSIESMVWLLTRELVRLGHQVTVFGTEGSETAGDLIATLPGPYGEKGSPGDWHLCEWMNLSRAVADSGSFDVIHSHNYLWGIPLEPLARSAMVHTLHIAPDDDTALIWARSPESIVTAISKFQWSGYPRLQPHSVIPHGVDASHFTFCSQPGDYLLYLGRFISGKGPCQAIAVARRLGMRLLMAGPRNAYFKERIEPLIDGKSVEYVGFVKGIDRDKIIGGARALIYPIQYPEPFGLVLVEAMLCGTPIAAINLGAVPEVVDQGVTGYYSDNMDGFLEMVERAIVLDRRKVREQALRRFSPERMARAYVEAYERAIQRAPE